MNASSVLLTGFLGAGPSAPRVLSREPLLVLRGPRSPLRGRTPAVATRAEGEQGAATRARPRRGERGCAAGLGLPASLARGGPPFLRRLTFSSALIPPAGSGNQMGSWLVSVSPADSGPDQMFRRKPSHPSPIRQ